jgi:hypothetical protein
MSSRTYKNKNPPVVVNKISNNVEDISNELVSEVTKFIRDNTDQLATQQQQVFDEIDAKFQLIHDLLDQRRAEMKQTVKDEIKKACRQLLYSPEETNKMRIVNPSFDFSELRKTIATSCRINYGTGIGDLCDDLIEQIFGFLKESDRRLCRQTCTRWRQLTDQVRSRQPTVFRDGSLCYMCVYGLGWRMVSRKKADQTLIGPEMCYQTETEECHFSPEIRLSKNSVSMFLYPSMPIKGDKKLVILVLDKNKKKRATSKHDMVMERTVWCKHLEEFDGLGKREIIDRCERHMRSSDELCFAFHISDHI